MIDPSEYKYPIILAKTPSLWLFEYNGSIPTSFKWLIYRWVLVIFLLTGSSIFTDIGASTVRPTTLGGGQVGNIVNSARTSENVGLIFYDHGVAVFDLEKITSGSQFMSGAIDAMHPLGYTVLGGAGTETENTSKFIPDFMVSGSIDNIIDQFLKCTDLQKQILNI